MGWWLSAMISRSFERPERTANCANEVSNRYGMRHIGRRWCRCLAALALSVLVASGCGGEFPAPSEADDAAPDTTPSDVSAPAGSTPSNDPSSEEAGASGGIGWEDLESLAFESSGQSIQLSGGRATVSYGGASTDVFTLQNRVAAGDLDADGDDDLVAHIVVNSAGTGVFHLIVPVINDDGVATALPAASVGDRVVLDGVLVGEGRVQVSLFDRADGEPFTVITVHKTLEIDLAGSEPSVRVIGTEPIGDLPLPGPELPDVDVRFEPGAVSAAVSGSIEFRQRQTYTLQAAAGQAFTATLGAPIGVWLDVRLGDEVIAAATERFQRVEATLPAAGAWRVTVVSAHAGPAEYELSVEALPLGSDSPQPPTTTTDAPADTQPPTDTPPPTTTTDAPADTQPPTTTTDAPAATSAGPGGVVYLTFDDGPHPTYTPQVLDILARREARATFFVLGSLAEARPELIARIVAEGHTVANHAWNHENLAGLPRSSFDDTIGRTQAVLADRATPCLRPPYGSIDAFTREWAASAGLDLVLWTVDTNDWRRPGAQAIADRIVRGATDEAIVLMHDGGGNRTQTVEGLELALDRLSGRGLQFEPVCT